jgi:hypothetical protein
MFEGYIFEFEGYVDCFNGYDGGWPCGWCMFLIVSGGGTSFGDAGDHSVVVIKHIIWYVREL